MAIIRLGQQGALFAEDLDKIDVPKVARVSYLSSKVTRARSIKAKISINFTGT